MLNRENKIFLFLGALLTFCSLILLLRYRADSLEQKRPFRLAQGIRLLVIAPHPDDETIMAGGLMLQNEEMHGTTRVLYITSGADRFAFSATTQRLYRLEREREAKRALRAYGKLPISYRFYQMGEKKQPMRRKTEELVKKLTAELRLFDPDMIFTSAYEGGHCIHDWTNYAVSQSAATLHMLDRLFEVTEYHPYISWQTPEKLLKILFAPLVQLFYREDLHISTQFIPDDIANVVKRTPIFQASLTKKELARKDAILKLYTTQNVRNSLLSKFAFAEKFRPFPGHDYTRPPFTLRSSLLFRFIPRSKAVRYGVCRITFQKFRRWLQP